MFFTMFKMRIVYVLVDLLLPVPVWFEMDIGDELSWQNGERRT